MYVGFPCPLVTIIDSDVYDEFWTVCAISLDCAGVLICVWQGVTIADILLCVELLWLSCAVCWTIRFCCAHLMYGCHASCCRRWWLVCVCCYEITICWLFVSCLCPIYDICKADSIRLLICCSHKRDIIGLVKLNSAVLTFVNYYFYQDYYCKFLWKFAQHALQQKCW